MISEDRLRALSLPKSATAPRATKNQIWFVTRFERSENQPSSGVGTVVADDAASSTGFAVAAAEPEVVVNAGFEFSPSDTPWSPGRCAVG